MTAMMTVADGSAQSQADRDVAMKFYATGSTAESLRARAADPELMNALAVTARTSPASVLAEALKIADAIDALTAEGLTPAQCWVQAGLVEKLGSYPFAV